MGTNVTDLETSLVIRLTGHHTMIISIVGNVLQVLMPGAAITFTDVQAIRGMYRAWVEARLEADNAFRPYRKGEVPVAPRYPIPSQVVTAAVKITGTQPDPLIMARTADAVRNRAAQVAVRLGRVTIVCDDHAAFVSQHQGWTEAYERASDLWPIQPISTARDQIEAAAWERKMRP
ncbi:hypothetical protein ACFQ07_28575 [Actinomadura adrarensis]|uniref:Uncharacterized protein n=1 Tax=Actinomadura adrarensis TaxID=1819600 RepID=A0ABW3CNW2_9ACTN